MNWTELLNESVKDVYQSTEGLMKQVDDGMLDWKPETGQNWMTVGQLLMHINSACGACCKGFVTGDWGMPEGVKIEDLPMEEMLPPAEKMPSVETIAQAREGLAADQKVALEMLEKAGENDLAGKITTAPWNPAESLTLGRHLLQMISHLAQHKAQLFYYLKLMGKPVNTMHLYGM